MKLSRGVRNNNPANIRRSATKWAFLKPVQSDKQFCQFLEIRYGIRAFFILMRTYRYKYSKANQQPTYEKTRNSNKLPHHFQRQEQTY